MPVSESEKLGVSVLGCHFSEKAEHIPIKKRRFLFRASSPPRHETSPKAYNHELKVNPNPTCQPESVTGTCGRVGNDDKLVKKEVAKKAKNEPCEDDDFSGISILAAAACSNSLGAEADRCEGSGTGIGIGIGIVSSVTKSPEAPITMELKENVSKSANICTQESDSHTSTTTKDHSVPDKFTLDKSSSQPPSESAIPTARDVKFNWDLNTVMDAWEEPFVEEKKDDCTKDNSGDYEPGSKKESVIPSKDTNLNVPVELKSLGHENELKPGNNMPEPLSCELDNARHSVAVESTIPVTTESAIPVTAESSIPVTRSLNLEESTHGIFSKWATRGGQTSCGTDAVDTKLSMDCSIPPGFDHCLNLHASKENPVAESAIPVTTQTAMTNPCKPEYERHDSSLTPAASTENIVLSNRVEAMVKVELTSNDVSKGTELPQQPPAAIPSIRDSEAPLENGIGYDNPQSDNRAGSGYDSQYEDGELRESNINAWKGENEYVINNKGDNLNIGITDSHEPNSSQCRQESSPGIKPPETDLTSSVVLPEKIQIHNTDEVVLTGSEPNEVINERHETVQHVNQSDEWKMNVSGLDHLPENQRIPSNNFTKTRNFTSRKFSYGEQKDGFDPEDMEPKGEGSRFYRSKESLTRIGGPSTRDVFLSRGRFRVQGCSSKTGDGLASRPERESGVVRSFGRGRYSPHDRGTGRGSGVWNRSPERGRDMKRLPSPTYHSPPFLRNMLEDSGSLDNITNEGSMDPNEANRPNTSSYVNRRPFRSRSPMNREANDFRARLGLRPTGDTGHERFNMGRGRGRGRVGQVRYGTRVENDGPGPRRYHGPGSDDCDEFLTEYFPRRRRCFSPIERRGNGNGNHYSDSRSPSRPRTRSPVSNSGFRRRSRSPNFRIRRTRSPNYRHGFEPEYNPGSRNNNSSPPPNSRWVNYKERGPAVFDRRSSPPPQGERERERERFSFYERKPKQSEYYRSGQPGRFDPSEAGRGRPRYVSNEGDRPDNGYRRGGFVRRYNMDGHVKRFQYDDEDGFGRGFDARDKHALEVHARGNLKSNGTDGRIRDFSRRSREDREVVVGGGGEFKRRSRERKDSEHKEEKEEQHIVKEKDQSNLVDSNEVVKEGDSSKPMLGAN